MFPLRERIVTQLFGKPMFYSPFHIGADYRAPIGTEVYAPFDGRIIHTMYGVEGGYTTYFVPDHDAVGMRFMHLSKFLAGVGKVTQGQPIALSGATGKLVRGAHLHQDLSRCYETYMYWKKPSNMLDPELYDWSWRRIPVETNATAIPAIYDDSRWAIVEVVAEAGVKERTSPYTNLLNKVRTRMQGERIDVIGEVLGTEVEGNNVWYILRDMDGPKNGSQHNFIWSGAVRVLAADEV